jgi:hypothetical protein
MSCGVIVEVKTGLKYITSLLKNQVLIVMFHQFLTFDSFWLMFTGKLLNIILVKSNRYYQQHARGQEDKIWQPDICIDELYCFLALIILKGHDVWDIMKDYWSTSKLHGTPVYPKESWNMISLCT